MDFQIRLWNSSTLSAAIEAGVGNCSSRRMNHSLRCVDQKRSISGKQSVR